MICGTGNRVFPTCSKNPKLLHISQPDRFSTREAESCDSVRETYFRIAYAASEATIEKGLAVLK